MCDSEKVGIVSARSEKAINVVDDVHDVCRDITVPGLSKSASRWIHHAVEVERRIRDTVRFAQEITAMVKSSSNVGCHIALRTFTRKPCLVLFLSFSSGTLSSFLSFPSSFPLRFGRSSTCYCGTSGLVVWMVWGFWTAGGMAVIVDRGLLAANLVARTAPIWRKVLLVWRHSGGQLVKRFGCVAVRQWCRCESASWALGRLDLGLDGSEQVSESTVGSAPPQCAPLLNLHGAVSCHCGLRNYGTAVSWEAPEVHPPRSSTPGSG